MNNPQLTVRHATPTMPATVSPTSSIAPNPLVNQVCVALDLETTGLDPQRDEIIEIGAVKFQGQQVVDTFHTLVNPYRPLPPFIQRLTGITQRELMGAPPFAAVAGGLPDFVGECPIVGHNLAFDLGFLARRGIRLSNSVCDTLEMAGLFFPDGRDYSLAALARTFDVEHSQPHRALPDAQAARQVFLRLLERAQGLDPAVLEQLRRMAARWQWPVRHVLETLAGKGAARSTTGLLGVDTKAIAARIEQVRPLSAEGERRPLDAEEVVAMLQRDGPLWRCFPRYEVRPQQVEMVRAATQALSDGHHLVLEGGTGVGKSIGYLLPAILFALRNSLRVVVSTNTINLQEQLMYKDIPALVAALEKEGLVAPGAFRYAVLKGKANYLCLRRWASLLSSDMASPEEARLLGRVLVWLQSTASGDRGELHIRGQETGVWESISARGSTQCPGRRDGACFYRAARERAEAAHILVVNHALLLSDLALGGGLLPPYDYLIVDEAHHLEEEATRHFGFRVAQGVVEELAQRLTHTLRRLRIAVGLSTLSAPARERQDALAQACERAFPTLQKSWNGLCDLLLIFMERHRDGEPDQQEALRITGGTRAQPAWSEIEILADNFHKLLGESRHGATEMASAIGGLPESAIPERDTLALEVADWLYEASEMDKRTMELMLHPEREMIYWAALERKEGFLALNGAPLKVGPLLEERLFSQKRSVMLTSATLATQGSFQYIRQRLGLAEGEERLVDSPFDFPNAVLLFVPEDMPAPDDRGYSEGLQQAVADLARVANGHTMALFTSHASLQAAQRGLVDALAGDGIQVLAQGVDGPPHRLIAMFQDDPRAVLLGTSSFWEGVDISGGLLKVLVVARLPFNIPTEPVFATRSQLFHDPFNEYAVPQAVLRFRQGFGRLIRSQDDRGAVVVLDRRIISRPYGGAFLGSIPRCAYRRGALRQMPQEVKAWLSR